SLETHILDVVNLILWEKLTDVVLCGHSYGGGVITGVADRIPDRIRSLVYLDAFILETGENLAQFVPADRVVDGWKVLPIPAGGFNVNFLDREWVDQQCTIQSLECWQQRISLDGGIARIKNITYILANGWAGLRSPFIPFYEKAKAKGWKTLTMSCGHDAMLD